MSPEPIYMMEPMHEVTVNFRTFKIYYSLLCVNIAEHHMYSLLTCFSHSACVLCTTADDVENSAINSFTIYSIASAAEIMH